jgi:hypothetical protein
MVKRRGPPSQDWKMFLHNHADGIAAMDLFVVPTISFRLLYRLLIMGQLIHRLGCAGLAWIVSRHSASSLSFGWRGGGDPHH